MKARSTEIMRADPAARRRALVILAVLTAALAMLMYEDPVDAWFDHIRLVAKTDPGRAHILVQNTTRVFMVLLWSLGASALAVALWCGRKFWKAERWPPVGAKLIRDTPVMYGKQLRVIALVFLCLGVFVFGVISYATWKFSTVFLYGL